MLIIRDAAGTKSNIVHHYIISHFLYLSNELE